ncbi:hypothetical protein EV368DRAFT_83534 [Lentinula lateritia]|nr:hypothetical protein EV368DRAFT_83534 [Lentinula lateritia]
MAGGLTSLPGLVGRDNTAAIETNTIIVFDIMNVVGLLLTGLVLLPALLSPMVSRTSTWMALMASSIFYSSSYLLLLPIGQRSVAQPGYGICLFQASLIYGAPVLVSFAGWAYVLQLLIAPVAMACIMFIVSLVVGAQSPNTVTIDSTRRYCHIISHVPRTTAAILIGIGTVGMMVFEVLLSMHLSRNWVTLKKVTEGEISIFAWYKFGRIIIFTILPFGAFALNIGGFFSSGTTNDKWNILLPIRAALIFGSRTDIIYAWKMSYKAEATWNIYEDPKPVCCSCPHCGEEFDTIPGSVVVSSLVLLLSGFSYVYSTGKGPRTEVPTLPGSPGLASFHNSIQLRDIQGLTLRG